MAHEEHGEAFDGEPLVVIAPQIRIARALAVCSATVHYALRELIAAGFVEVHTPPAGARPGSYRLLPRDRVPGRGCPYCGTPGSP